MDGRLIKFALVVSAFFSLGATYKTPNFVVDAPTDKIAKQVAVTAERCREELSIAWLGKSFPKWNSPCKVRVKVGQIGAGGATTFAFDKGEVFGWRMTVQGTLERILDSVIPHEVSHTVFATHFRRPLPRWADEGAATLVEHESERRRQQLLLEEIMRSSKRIPMRKLLAMKEYPSGMQNVMTLYAQGYSLADYLVEKGGRARYLHFLEYAHRNGWDKALQSHYKIENAEQLDKIWDGWVMAGSPRMPDKDGVQLADAGTENGRPQEPDVVVRAQTPDAPGSRTVAGRQSRARLELPQGSVTRNVTAALDGRERAHNDGWETMPADRRSRPRPLTMQVEVPTASTSANTQGQIRRDNAYNAGQHRHDPFLP